MAGRSEAWLNGWLAHKQGYDVSRNPYTTTIQAYSAAQWDGGWCERFSRCKGKNTADHTEYDDVAD